jgi:hypothetical protein
MRYAVTVLVAVCGVMLIPNSSFASGVDFSTQVQPLFTSNGCTGCHGSSSGSAGLDLSTGKSYANLVNVASTTASGSMRVKPSYSANSVLYQKVSATAGHHGIKPSSADITTIKDWIDQGALASAGGGGAGNLTLAVSKLSGAAICGQTGKDSVKLTGIISNVAQNFSPSTKTVVVDVGGATATFILSDKGAGKSETGSIKLKMKLKDGVFAAGGDVPFQASFKGTFATAWADEGVNWAQDYKGQISMLVSVSVDGTSTTATFTGTLTTKANKKASFK